MNEHPCAEFIAEARAAQDKADNLEVELRALKQACADVLATEQLLEVSLRLNQLMSASYPAE